jgi:3'(2'), 5'-bisphosphate nucleotidase / inositol polyphosphate 1-phosphatase
VFKLY